MTSKDIDWTKFDELIEASKQTTADFLKIKELDSKEKELCEEQQKLRQERKEISDKYSQEYTDKLNDRLDKYGILTVITSNDHGEAYIISATEDVMKIRFLSNYGQRKNELDISVKELKEKGFVKYEKGHDCIDTCYIVDKITNPLYVFEIIEFRLKQEIKDLERNLKWGKDKVEDGSKCIKESTEKLKEFSKVSDGKIKKVFNSISFGVTNLSIDEVLKALPREIKLYEVEEYKDEKATDSKE